VYFGREEIMLRILVADDHEIVKRGLRALLESKPEWTVVAEASNGREAVEQADRHKPNVAVLDISMPELGGLEAARRIRKLTPETEILFLTVHNSAQMLQEALDAGGRGYVLKSDVGNDLLIAVDTVTRHKTFVSRGLSGASYTTTSKESGEAGAARLTSREREVLQILAEGKSTKEVATLLDIAVKTAETHRTNIMRKLDLHSVSELVLYAIRNQIVEP
jgi:DNA-binding NarL/FixJ family response regulator